MIPLVTISPPVEICANVVRLQQHPVIRSRIGITDQEQIIENPRNESKILADEHFTGKTSQPVTSNQPSLFKTNIQCHGLCFAKAELSQQLENLGNQ